MLWNLSDDESGLSAQGRRKIITSAVSPSFTCPMLGRTRNRCGVVVLI
jgi:hypothetical protein